MLKLFALRQCSPLALVGLWLLTAISCAAIDPSSPAGQLLAGPNFRVTARFTRMKFGGPFWISEEFITEEFYSNRQGRAEIQLHRVREQDGSQAELQSVYHYFGAKLVVQSTVFGRGQCGPISPTQLVKDLFGSLKLGKDYLEERPEVPDHVVGLARLLFIIDHNRADLLARAPDTYTTRIRGHHTIVYQLPDSVESGALGVPEGLRRIYYAQTRDHEGGFDLPLRVDFRDKDYGLINLGFFSVGPMEEDLLEHEADDSWYPMNEFALPVGIGCSQKMATAKESGWQPLATQVASFQAVIYKHNKQGTKQSAISERFVAYDSQVGAMRSDAISPTSYSTTIIDMWNKRKYNLLAGGGEQADHFSRRPCVASRVADPDKYSAFLPYKELVFMGEALVRGVQCHVFEHTTDQLPPALFPLLTYTNLKGREESIFGRDPQTYTVVYYFAINEASQKQVVKDLPGGPLTRVDVYRKRQLQYHMEVFDYMNQLVEAPNGDRQEELFALRDRCSSGRLGADGYASLQLELDFKPTGSRQKSAQEVRDILAGPHQRNKATLRALARGPAGLVTRISDLETQIRLSPAGDLKIFAESQIDVPDVELSEVRQVGWSSQESEASAVKTIEECFQWAAHAQAGSQSVLFVSCANSCTIDLTPVVEYGPDGRSIKSIVSDIYKADPKRSSARSCPAMLIEPSSADKRTREKELNSLRATFNWIRSDFDGKMLRFVMPKHGFYNYAVDVLIFEVSKVDINNDKWSVALGYEKAHLGGGGDGGDDKDGSSFELPARGFAEAIDGLGLTETIGQLQQPREKEASLDEEPTMSYQMCHSICMAKLECRSFSVCVTRRGVECIISEVEFRDKTLLKELEAKLGENEQQPTESPLKIRTIQLANPARAAAEQSDSDDLDDEAGAQYERIELKVDFRCRLHKKNALEMFHRITASRVAIKNSALTAVGSQEQCAEICLRNNMVFFTRMAQTKLKLMRSNEDELDDEELIRRLRDQYNSNLMSWCSTFHYLGTKSPYLDERAKALIDPKKLEAAGLCVIARAQFNENDDAKKTANKKEKTQTDETPAVVENVGRRIRFESFQMLYSNLFDVQYGVRLEEADKDDQGKPLPMVLRSRREIAPNAESCAHRCFLQACNLEPWCKSFDFVESRVRDPESRYGRSDIHRYCLFHTLSLAEIRQNGLVEFMVTDLASPPPSPVEADKNESAGRVVVEQSWHYDSRESYTLEDALLAELLLDRSEATLLEELQAYRLHAFGIVAILLAAAALSAAIVVLHADRVVNRFTGARRDSIADPSKSFLGSLVPGSSSPSGGLPTVSSSIKHKRFVASDQDLPDIPELNPI